MEKLSSTYENYLIELTYKQGIKFQFIYAIIYLVFTIVEAKKYFLLPIFTLRCSGIILDIVCILGLYFLYRYKKQWLIPFYSIVLTYSIFHLVLIGHFSYSTPEIPLDMVINFPLGFSCVFLAVSLSSFGASKIFKYTSLLVILSLNILFLIDGITEYRALFMVNFFGFFMYIYLSRKEKYEYDNYHAIQSLQAKESALMASNERIDSANKSLLEINRALSHDLKSPLRNISSFTQLLNRSLKGNISSSQKEYIDFIIQGSKDMQSLIDDILNFSKVSWVNNDMEWVNLNNLFEQLKRNYQSQQLSGTLDLSIEPINLNLNGNKTRYYLLFQNLIDNGIKYNESSIKKISIRHVINPNYIKFYIQDNGIGISEEYHARIFDIFSRLHTKNIYNGSGIGLASCKTIMEQIGGQIEVKSEIGKGSTFILSFPSKLIQNKLVSKKQKSIIPRNIIKDKLIKSVDLSQG